MRKKIMVPIALMLVIQLAALVGWVFLSGILPAVDQNASAVLQERVIGRARDLERDMLSRWSNLDGARDSLNALYNELTTAQQLTPQRLTTDPAQYNSFLTQAAETLVRTMRANATTGAFVVLCTESDRLPDAPNTAQRLPALYVRDSDPVSGYSAANADLLLEYAPTQVVSALGLSTNTHWSPMLSVPAGQPYPEFFAPVYQAAQQNADLAAKDLARWSAPYLLAGNSESQQVISYTVPLIGADGTLYGVLGVDILLSYLEKLLPYTEIGGNAHGAYLLGRAHATPDGSTELQVALATGAPYAARLKAGDTLSLVPEPLQKGLFRVTDGLGEQEILAYSQPLKLYNSNAPFADEIWTLVAAMPRDALFTMSHRISLTFAIMAGLMVLISIIALLVVVKVVSAPIVALAQEMHACSKTRPIVLPKTNISEMDALASAVETLSDSLYHSARKFSDIVEMSSNKLGGFEINTADYSLFINDDFFEVFGIESIQASTLGFDEFKAMFYTIEEYLIEEKSEPDKHGNEKNEYLFRLPRMQAPTLWVRLRVTRRGALATGLAEDVSREQQELENMAYERDHDVLTGLYNRRAFNRILQELLQKPAEDLGIGVLLMLDLDNLKYVNDTYGHDTGDLYICAAAETLRRHQDHRALLARMSGDEFMMFFYCYDSRSALEQRLETVQEAFRAATLRLPSGARYPMRASGGLAWFPADSMEFDTLKRYADFAMYKVKHNKKGEFANFSMKSYQQEAYLLENKEALNELVEQQLVEYYFQPIVDASTGQIFAYEALMRSRVPALTSPEVVLRLARQESKLYLIERLTWFCALDAFSVHCEHGNILADCKVFINSIPTQILSDQDIALLEQRFAPYLSRIVQEHTEEEQMDSSLQRRKSDYLENWGGQTALDDFGSGYNSDKVLLSYTPDYIKIDRVLLSGIDANANKQQIVRSIITHARARGIRVIGEGVETFAELKQLIELGVDYLQGYYLARPAPLPPTLAPDCVEEIRALAARKL